MASPPVVVVSARHDEAQKIAVLDAGADDYLVKPFGVGELLARVRVALRHRGTRVTAAVTRYVADGLAVDVDQRLAEVDGSPVHLTPTEFKLLARLVRNAGQVVTHRQLLADVWGAEYTTHTHYLRIYMANLRAKLETDPAEPRHLLTEPGVGYRLALD
jgi:two-component system KDP operon response regulator KdpE